jgi:amino acid transporter
MRGSAQRRPRRNTAPLGTERLSILQRSKRLLIGPPMETERLAHERLGKVTALAVFASDNLSSSAYATEEILRVLLITSTVGAVAFRLVLPITIALLAVLGILLFSYRQTIKAYPNGGGAYVVTRDNFGVLPAQVAGVALLTDYTLTVSVSVSAGTAALVSALPGVFPWRVHISILFIAIIAWGNLRGIKESGRIFAVPTYFFIGMMGVLIGVGVFRMFFGGLAPAETFALPQETHALTLFVILHAFASGGAAVTGVEAISNGVPAFKTPEWKNARTTLMWMGGALAAMFLGLSVLAQRLHVVPDPEEKVTVIAQIGRSIFGGGAAGHVLFAMLQIGTLLILVLAANTSFADFPRLASFHAADRYLPRQMRMYGDRLVFSNGILVLSASAALLVIAFQASVTRLIPLYAIGVFMSFTFSQTGMAKHHMRLRERGWRTGFVINGFGGIVSAIMTVIIAVTKFSDGAYLILIAMPLILAVLIVINRHYTAVARSLRHEDRKPPADVGHHVILLVGRPSEEERRAFAYAEVVESDSFRCVHFAEPDDPKGIEAQWTRELGLLATAPTLEIVRSRGSVARAVRRYVEDFRKRIPSGDFVTVIVSERVGTGASRIVGSRQALLIKIGLLFTPGVVVTDVPNIVGVQQNPLASMAGTRHEAVLLVSGVHNATLHALEYARALEADAVHAVHISVEDSETTRLVADWEDWGLGLPLETLPSPYRDIDEPLLTFIRERTGDARTIVTVVMPEFIVKRWWHNLLHNQTAATLKRAFLSEPGVVVTSVPYRLE